MAMVKNNQRGLCPFRELKKCSEKCVLYRKGFRYKETDPTNPIPFEDCAINILADNSEATHHRIFTLQKEFGELKNISAFSTLVSLGMEDPNNLARMVKGILKLKETDDTKLVE
jgi:hypothetical protein